MIFTIASIIAASIFSIYLMILDKVESTYTAGKVHFIVAAVILWIIVIINNILNL